MGEPREALKEALEIEAEAVEGVEAARAEQELGQPAISAELLLGAIEKERKSLDLLEEGVETLKQALEERRQALEQQAEILQSLAAGMNEK
jgi:hypothetical protein